MGENATAAAYVRDALGGGEAEPVEEFRGEEGTPAAHEGVVGGAGGPLIEFGQLRRH